MESNAHQSFNAYDRHYQAIVGRGRVLQLSVRRQTIRTDAQAILTEIKRTSTNVNRKSNKRRRLAVEGDEPLRTLDVNMTYDDGDPRNDRDADTGNDRDQRAT